MATTHSLVQELLPETQFALDYVGALAADQYRSVHREADEQAVVEMAAQVERVEERLLVLDSLYRVATNRELVAAAIEAGEDLKYGNGLIEVASLLEVPKERARVLAGKNPALIVRAGLRDHEDSGDTLAPPTEFNRVGVEQFPKPSMPTGSSGLHLDNFLRAQPGKTGFRYTFSTAELETGKVLFIAGLAGKRARNERPKVEGVSHPYDEALIRLEADPKVKNLYKTARDGRPKPYSDFQGNEGTHVVAVVLNPGDTVLWPQGGPGSEIPAWHAFRKIGDLERSSVSSHYVQQ